MDFVFCVRMKLGKRIRSRMKKVGVLPDHIIHV